MTSLLQAPDRSGRVPLEQGLAQGDSQQPQEFERLWRAFMTARATLGLVLVLLQGGIFVLTPQQNPTPLMICSAYFVMALAVRLMMQPQHMGRTFDEQWLRTVGVDLLAFAALQSIQHSNINYAPLFALPVLMASVLGSLIMAMGTAAGVTLMLFGYASWMSLQAPAEITAQFMQAALTGLGCFAISFIASQLANRLATVESNAQRSQLAATVQRQVNELVIASLNDGIVVVDEQLWVRSANPAAFALLGVTPPPDGSAWPLTGQPGWQELLDLVTLSHTSGQPQQTDISIQHEGQGSRHLRVQTRITSPLEAPASALCVVFMQDQREMQARLRTEKLASMGRMSAAVAHEIRNPLAAIVQANALLNEDITEPSQLRMTKLVQQNAQRLEKIVNDILHLAHAPHTQEVASGQLIVLEENVERVCRDWQRQSLLAHPVKVSPAGEPQLVWFDVEHLRRILINLLDNARRFSSGQEGSIQVSIKTTTSKRANAAQLCVWSDGDPLEPSVEKHLFEPFFSSDSRSSGLGLYICRELCESHGATMTYDRTNRPLRQTMQTGNEFSVVFSTLPPGKQAVDNTTASAA